MSATHRLKTHPEPLEAIIEGRKTFEFRKDDRTPRFEVGDELDLFGWDPSYFGGRGGDTEMGALRRVTYILRGPAYGIPEGYCVMSLAELEGEKQCNCTACPTMVPRSWYSGMCYPCADADCDCSDREEPR